MILCAIAVLAGCISARANELPPYNRVEMRLPHDGFSIVRQIFYNWLMVPVIAIHSLIGFFHDVSEAFGRQAYC